MILQELSKYYDRISADPKSPELLPKPGYSLQSISFAVVLHPDGRVQGFQSINDGGKKPRPQKLLVPGQGKPPGSGINPCFLWDNSAYMLGFKLQDPKPQRTAESFERFRQRLLDAENAVHDESFSAFCKFLRNWSPQKAAEHAAELEPIVTHFGVFKIAGQERYVHDDPEVVAYWTAHGDDAADADGNASEAICLVTGKLEPIALVHEPKIKGVNGAQSSGALLVSFNANAYESFGKEQGANAPVGKSAAFKYTNALNYLLSRRDRRTNLADATVTYWAEQPTMLEEILDPLLAEMKLSKDGNAPAEDKERAEQIRRFVNQLRTGSARDEAIDPESEVGFYILGLSPNASRLSVRFWIRSTVGEMKARLRQHMSDIELAGACEFDPPLVIRRIVEATGRAEKDSNGNVVGYDDKSVSPLLAGAMAEAVLSGGRYPAMLLVAVLNRLRSDRCFTHPRLSAIKGFLTRNTKKEMPVSLNTDHPSPAYHCGRLLSLLDYIQGQAIGNVNAGIVKKFYTVASVQPFAVMGRLVALTTKAHLPKLDSDDHPGFSQFCERLLRQIISKIGDRFPRTLTLEEQGEFALGFYNEKEELPDTPPRYFSTTARGEQVRSRAEVTVADALYALGIDYEYERPLNVPGHRLMKPDFTVLGATRRETTYIEYLGLSDNADYNERWQAKLTAFKAAGVAPHEEGGGPHGRLITFTGTKTSGINSAEIRKVLKAAFNTNGGTTDE